MSDEDALTADGLWRRCDAKRAVAERMVDDRRHCREAWVAAGTAVEFALKAVICEREKFNAWPSKAHRPDLHIHDLRKLLAAAGVDLRSVPKGVRPSLRQVLDWDRNHDYSSARMRRKMAHESPHFR